MGSPAISSTFAPAPVPPTAPYGAFDNDASFAAGSSDDLTDKQQRDLAMRKEFGTLWRDSWAQSSQMKAEQRAQDNARTADYLEQKDHSAEPCMSNRQPAEFDLNLHWSTGPGSDDDAPSQNAKRSVASAQDDSAWQPVYTKTSTSLFQDQASLQSFYNELNGLACSDNACSSGTSVSLEWTGQRPDDGREPFTYPVLIDNALRVFDPKGFNAAGSRLHAVSFPAPYPFMNNRPPFQREAVRVMASSSECEHIKPFQPASCTTFPAGDPVAHIDKFFTDNRAQGKVPGAVFADRAIIEKWARESSLRGGTALAIGTDKESINIIIGLCIGSFTLVSAIACCMFRGAVKQCPRALASRVKSCWNSGMSAASTLWNKCLRTPPVPAARSAGPSPQAEVEDDSVVIDDSDSDSNSAHRDDFSSSTASSTLASSSKTSDHSENNVD